MDISPKTLREVEFREKFRGYHPEDVDTFLERVAAAVESMQTQLRQAAERTARAEELAAHAGTADEALSRTLLLAQRTADMAVQEAEQQSTQLVEEATLKSTQMTEDASQKSTQMVEEAQTRADAMLDTARTEAQRISEEAQSGLRDELAALLALRQQLRTDVEVLQQWIDEHRTALTGSLREVLAQLDGELVVRSDAPEIEPVTVPPIVDRASVTTGPEDGPGADPDGSAPVDPVEEGAVAPAAGAAEVQAPEAASAVDEVPDGVEVEPVVPLAEPAPSAIEGPGDGDVDGAVDAAVEGVVVDPATPPAGVPVVTAEPAAAEPDPAASGAAAAEDELDEGHADDPFMAELRRAVSDNEPLGPRDEADTAPFDNEDHSLETDLDGSRRFGSRLRRRH